MTVHRSIGGPGPAQADPFSYMPYISLDYDEYLAYVTKMAQNREWGGQLEAGALGKGLARPVRIWRANEKVSLGSRPPCAYFAISLRIYIYIYDV